MKLKDVDSAELVFKLRAAAFAAVVGVMTIAGGAIVSGWAGTSIWLGVLAGVVAAVFVYYGSMFMAEQSGRAAASVFSPSGSSTPPIREYSLADSLIARGRIEEATEAYTLLSEDYPTDPEPRLRHVRLLRDYSKQFTEAAAVFKSILGLPQLKPQTELVVLHELTELFIHKLHEPTRASPYLARIIEKFGATPTGNWARTELKEIKQQMQTDS